jgi:hypothetical protein
MPSPLSPVVTAMFTISQQISVISLQLSALGQKRSHGEMVWISS